MSNHTLSTLISLAATAFLALVLLDVLGWLPYSPAIPWVVFPLAAFLLIAPLLRR